MFVVTLATMGFGQETIEITCWIYSISSCFSLIVIHYSLLVLSYPLLYLQAKCLFSTALRATTYGYFHLFLPFLHSWQQLAQCFLESSSRYFIP